ncbi:MAG: hypothetical protein AB7H80_18175, partial [Candidatus Kapaibacterium sp.]
MNFLIIPILDRKCFVFYRDHKELSIGFLSPYVCTVNIEESLTTKLQIGSIDMHNSMADIRREYRGGKL